MQDIIINDINVSLKNINVKPVNVGQIDIQSPPSWMFDDPSVLFVAPPTVVDIGVPIVNIPGCVEANKERNPKNTQLDDDPNGTLILCDGQTPSFNPLNFEPNQNLRSPTPKVKTQSPEKPAPPTTEVPTPRVPPSTAKIECPTKVQQAQEPVGTLVEGFRKEVVGYKLIDKTCVQITEPVALPTQILAGLPSGGQVMQVGGIAVIATSSALLAKPLADILLKAVKPAVKKVMKKISTLRGKKPPILSSGERRAEQRQMNDAVKALRSVFPRRKKKQKG